MVKKATMKEAENLSRFMQLLTHPGRIEKRPDGWFWDKFCGVDRAPLDKIKHLNFADGTSYAAEIGGQLAEDYELSTLINHSKERPAIIEPFKDIPFDDWYFTRTPCAWNTKEEQKSLTKGSVWCVGFSFGGGDVHSSRKGSSSYVWPVRSSQCQLDYLPVR